jgi:hypothetical protein
MTVCLADEVPEVTMSELVEREELLESSGYRYHFTSCVYVNRRLRRAFSVEFVEKHSREEIQRLLQGPATDEWVFHFNEPPADSVKRVLISEYEK